MESDGKVPEGMMEIEVPESEYIMTTHKGHVSQIGKTWNILMMEMLPDSDRSGDMEGISFEYYDSRYKEDDTNETDIYMPLK
jgi:predicted transcriptional regulator YdeE